MEIGTFRTIPLTNVDNEVGYIEHVLILGERAIEREPDKKAFIMHSIALQLRLLCERTATVPELWDFQPTPKIRQLTSLPESIPFR